MRVTKGFSGETGPNKWEKFSIGLDEEDVLALIQEHFSNINRAAIKTTLLFNLLNIELDILLKLELSSRGTKISQSEIQELKQRRADLVNRIEKDAADG